MPITATRRSSLRQRLMTVIAIGIMLAVSHVMPAMAAQSGGTPVPSTTLTSVPSAGDDPTMVSADEQALADKYVPIAMLKEQSDPCDTQGEPYLPLPVEVSLNDSQVTLRRAKRREEAEDPILKVGPSAQDLVISDSTYYLDLPGDSLNPGCDYEKWSQQRIAELDLSPSTYARVVTQASQPGLLVLQYFFYWVFDDFTNTHESDWEMVQLTFEANTAGEALTRDPILVTYAQHAGGENHDWDSDTGLQTEDDHLIIFPAAGSHADYYQDAIWLGWGAQGSGFGCDRIDAPLVRTPLKAIVIPREIDPNGPFAWALFQGRWGERHPWEFNGPLSPNVSRRWVEPVTWTYGLRDRSLPIPQQRTLGLGPSSFFCSISELGGELMTVVPEFPQVVATTVITLLVGLVLVSFLTWRYLRRAIWMYVRYFHIFLLSSILLVPVAAIGSWVQRFVERFVGSLDDLELVGDATGAIGIGLSFGLQLALIILIGPGVIYATARLVRGERVNFFSSVIATAPRFRDVAGASLWNTLVVLLLTLTVVGIPFAAYRTVQWAYSVHAVILDGVTPRSARHVSRNVIKGDWLRTIGMWSLVTYVAGLPGPIIGMLLLLTNQVSIVTAGTVSSLIFAVMYPITVITSTLYYMHRKQQKEERIAQGLPGDSPGQGFWKRLRHPLSWEERIPEPLVREPPIPGPAKRRLRRPKISERAASTSPAG